MTVAERDAATDAVPTITARERPFPNESLYPLLVAEFALRRHAYDVALEQYIDQASQLRDSGVSEHTTHLAQFLKREEDALEAATLWVELNPENAEANNTLAQLLARQGRAVEALPYLMAVQQETGDAKFPLLLEGFTQWSAAERTELIQDIDALAAEFPENTSLLLTQALIQAEAGEFDSALSNLDTLLDLDPEKTPALLLEAKILTEQNAAQPDERVQQTLRNHPDNNLLRLEYARLLAATDLPAARQQFELLSEQYPDDGDLLFSLALINHEIGDADAARVYLLQVIALGQRVDEAYYYLGRIAEENNNAETALSYYMPIAFGPEYFAATNRIGHILIEDDQLERFHAWFAEQRQKHPPAADQLYLLETDILAAADAQTAALQVLNQAILETPNSIPLRYGRAMLNEQLNNLALMERDLRAILTTEPNNTAALNALGYTLANRTTRYDEALNLISRALVLEPDEPAILDSMGWVLFRTEQYAASVDYLTRAYTVFPDAEVASHLGEALWAQGKTDAAIAVWQGALVREPGHPVLLDTLDRLGIDLPVSPTPNIYPLEGRP
ncbi:MAG: tetratricopeptide repeat protein [Halioglobus sp.]|nr:tetratricopeptide repeat protein [Halioglobus sp.]